MKKIFLAILLLFSVACTAEQPLPMELLDTWESVDDKIVKLKRHALFVCLQRFNPQSDFVDKHIFSHNHPEVWHMIPPKLLDELVAFTHKTILEANSGTNKVYEFKKIDIFFYKHLAYKISEAYKCLV